MRFSSLLNRFNESETLKLTQLARELQAKGIQIINFAIGEPDFDTPAHIKKAAIKAIDDNWTHYTPVAGFMDLREAICKKLLVDNNLTYKPENVIASCGAKQSLANVILALIDEGDEVIIPTPYWVTYSELVKIARGVVVDIRTTETNKFKITPQELEKAITPKTKCFMFSSPCNPSGSVYSKAELQALVAVFRKYPDIFIISDEIYEYINYTGKHESIAAFDDIKDRVILVNGLSKGFAMTGWRLGYIAAHKDIAKACDKLQGQFSSATCSITQKAAVAALLEDKTPSIQMTAAFLQRRNKTVELISQIKDFSLVNPDGAFYVFPNVSKVFGKSDGKTTIHNAQDLSMYLLEHAQVSCVMGDAFGEPNCMRFSFANSMANIEKGWKQIKEALGKLH